MKTTKTVVQYSNSGLNYDIVESGGAFISDGVRHLSFVVVFILNIKLCAFSQ